MYFCAKCKARKEIESFKNLKILHLSLSIIPDINVYDNENSPILFAEVESCYNFTFTIRKLYCCRPSVLDTVKPVIEKKKLCLELVTQLIYLRNMDTQKTNVCMWLCNIFEEI